MRTKLFLCLSPEGEYTFQSKEAVEDEIKYMEENITSPLGFTVVGNLFEDQMDEPHYLVIFSIDERTTIYDVLKGTADECLNQIQNKKRFAGKTIKIQRVMELKQLLEKYEQD